MTQDHGFDPGLRGDTTKSIGGGLERGGHRIGRRAHRHVVDQQVGAGDRVDVALLVLSFVTMKVIRNCSAKHT